MYNSMFLIKQINQNKCHMQQLGEGENGVFNNVYRSIKCLHIKHSINKRTILTKHQSRKRLHLKYWFSHFNAFCFVIPPHQPHLKTDAYGETRTRSPQPQHVVS